MQSFYESITEYRTQLKKGVIQNAYRGLMDYFMELRTHFQKKYPDYSISGSLYFGYMDMTYFALFPPSLKERGLKIAIVFVHEAFRFEVWLAGANKQVQVKYWEMFKESGWDKYPLMPSLKGEDAILTHVLAADPDFRDLDALTAQIERGALDFIAEIRSFFNNHSA